MDKYGMEVKQENKEIIITRSTKEVYIKCRLFQNGKVQIHIDGQGDLDHHLIEDAMIVLSKLANLKGIAHNIEF